MLLGDEFGKPDILTDNIAFWKKIYTELSLKEGYIHDNEYPLVIYRKVSIGGRKGRRRSRFVKDQKSRVKAMLQRIADLPEEELSDAERKVIAEFEKYGNREAAKDAIERIRFQQGQKERFYEGLCRSGAYLDTIRAVLTQYNIPLKLAYLPHVESSFNPYAYSKVGAAGLWQFMRGTGRLYLTINYNVDERRDPIASTYAAAKLLSHNYSVLQRWPLAITAYNHGLYGMKRAVAATGSRDIAVIIQRHKSRSFKFASKNFYSCFLAVCDIAAEPEKYFQKVEYHSPVSYTDIILTHYIRPSVLAKYLNVEASLLATLNPAVRPVVFIQDKLIPSSTRIHLPNAVALAFADSAMGAIPDSLKADKPPRPEYYRVSRGDNLYAIARRFGISARDLALENGISRMNRIYAGQVLRIPGTAKKADKAIASFVEDKRAETRLASRIPSKKEPLAPEKAKKPETVSEKPAPVEPAAELLHDSLEEIVMAQAESEPEVLDALQGGHQGRFDAEVYGLDIEISAVGNAASIRVSIDETLGHYADWLKAPAYRIRQLNRMGNRSTIRIGQRLTIPGDSASIGQFVQRRLEYHMALEEDFYSQFKVAEVRERIVERGENLWDLSSDAGEIPMWLLKKYNKHADLGRLMPGMRLWLPVVAEKTEEDYKEDRIISGGAYPYYQQPLQAPNKPVQIVP